MKAAAYVRVSSRQQSLEAQKSAILKAAEARGDEITHWYGEKASAYVGERAELAALRAAVRRGEHRKVYVFRIDRLSRAGVLGTFTIVAELKARAQGLDWGRPRVLLDDTIRIAAKRVAGGESVRKAAAELGVSNSTLHRALKRVSKATG